MRKEYKITTTIFVEKDSSYDKEMLEMRQEILSGELQREIKGTEKKGFIDVKITFEEIK